MATTTEIRQRIAAEVRAEMARQRLTQRDVAKVLDLTQPAVQLRLVGTRAFRAEELVKLADALGVPAAQFLAEDAEVAA